MCLCWEFQTSCSSGNTCDGPCAAELDFAGMNAAQKLATGRACGLDWLCADGCEQDFSGACPLFWNWINCVDGAAAHTGPEIWSEVSSSICKAFRNYCFALIGNMQILLKGPNILHRRNASFCHVFPYVFFFVGCARKLRAELEHNRIVRQGSILLIYNSLAGVFVRVNLQWRIKCCLPLVVTQGFAS